MRTTPNFNARKPSPLGRVGWGTKMNENLICGLDTAQIEALKQEKGALVLIEITAQGKLHKAIFREPTFKDLEAINKISKSDEMKGLRTAYDNCIIKADEEIENRDMLKIKAVSALMERVKKTTAEAKNL